MFANKFATRTATQKAVDPAFDSKVAAAVKGLYVGARHLEDNLEFLASKDITMELYEKYNVKKVVDSFLYNVHEDNQTLRSMAYDIIARISQCKRESDRKKMMKEEKWKADIDKQAALQAEEDQKAADRNAERRRKIAERLTSQKEKFEAAQKQLLQQNPTTDIPKTVQEVPQETNQKPRSSQPENWQRALQRLMRHKEEYEAEMREQSRKRKMPVEPRTSSKKPRIEVITIY